MPNNGALKQAFIPKVCHCLRFDPSVAAHRTMRSMHHGCLGSLERRGFNDMQHHCPIPCKIAVRALATIRSLRFKHPRFEQTPDWNWRFTTTATTTITTTSTTTTTTTTATTYYLLPTTTTTYYLLPTTYYLLPTTYYLLPTTYYLLPTTYYLLPTTY